MKRVFKWILGVLFFFFILGWIVELTSDKPKTVENTIVNNDIEDKLTNAIQIKKDDVPNWPLTVSEGRLWCDDGKILFLANGKLYGINGEGATFAQDKGGHNLKEIWAIDEKKKKELLDIGLSKSQAEVFMDISPILEKGKSLCK